MKKYHFKRALVAVSIIVLAVFSFLSCKKQVNPEGNFNKSTTAGALNNGRNCVSIPVDANGIITTNHLADTANWLLDGVSYVAPGQTLTIDPGTIIVTGSEKTYNDPDFGTQSLAGVLVVPVGAKINAIGTAAAPIIFTTPQRVGCSSGDCSTAGQFGGVVLLGDATINTPSGTARIEGVPEPAGESLIYGGSDDADNSGILRYVRIEFPGFRLDADNEINGLTLGGVGSGTELSHIQVSYSADDAFEFFGGSVNADHLVAIGTDDDDFDFDQGYSGTIDFAVGLKDPGSTHSTSGGNSDSNGIESDNDADGSSNTPVTRPTLTHFTLLGYNNDSNDLANGNRWRRASSLDIQYSIIAGFPTGVRYENIMTPATFANNVLQGFDNIFVGTGPTTPGNTTLLGASPSPSDFLGLAGAESTFFSCSVGEYSGINLIPVPGSPAYDEEGNYKGAFDPLITENLWTDNWTDFFPEFCCPE